MHEGLATLTVNDRVAPGAMLNTSLETFPLSVSIFATYKHIWFMKIFEIFAFVLTVVPHIVLNVFGHLIRSTNII
jgi:hypothetical protein